MRKILSNYLEVLSSKKITKISKNTLFIDLFNIFLSYLSYLVIYKDFTILSKKNKKK
jgi:uncharacterized membrane-anchored protein YitT (DUF2179 family)